MIPRTGSRRSHKTYKTSESGRSSRSSLCQPRGLIDLTVHHRFAISLGVRVQELEQRRRLLGVTLRDDLSGLGVPALDHERVRDGELHGLYELLLLGLCRPLQLVEPVLRPLFGALYGLQSLARFTGSHVDPPQVVEALVGDVP